MKNYNPGFVTLILGPLSGLLVLSGYVDPKNASDFTQQLESLLGAVITIVSIVGALQHDITVKKINQVSPVPPVTPAP